MKNPNLDIKKILFLIFLIFSPNIWASSQHCPDPNQPRILTPETLARTSQLVYAAQNILGDQQVALIARAGMNLQRYVSDTERDTQNLDYTHVGIAWRDAEQRWHILHLLNQCEAEQSSLFDSGLGAFFTESILPQFLIAIPDAQTQSQLLALVQTDLPQKLHQARYNLISAPNDPNSQNCTQWALEVLALHFAPPNSDFLLQNNSNINNLNINNKNWRVYAQKNLAEMNYHAPEFAIPFWLKMAGKAYAGSVLSFAKQSNPVRITTAWAVLQFLREHAPATRIEEYRLK